MPLYLVKAIVWNDAHYQRPGGGTFTSGYPKENGFGHEEWNNSTRLDTDIDGEAIHVFHTEGFGTQDLGAFSGTIFVFMIASHKGKQFLVAVAGNCTSLFGDEHRSKRMQLSRKLDITRQFREEAWSVRSVRAAFADDEANFRARWNEERHWFPVWFCPSDLYLGLHEAVELDPVYITGKRRLTTMYSAYQEIDRLTALRLISFVPRQGHEEKLERISTYMNVSGSEIQEDLKDLELDKVAIATTKRRLVDARLGQGKFRSDLGLRWNSACAVSGCTVTALLRASHIKPWRFSNNRERLDPDNGILLAAHLDSLFDSGLITFDESGLLVPSPHLRDDGRPIIQLGKRLRKTPSAEMRIYLAYHREHVFQA